MKKSYEIYHEITKELLDGVKVGDLVKFNDWVIPFRVKGVSENYFVAARKLFGRTCYSVCEKKPWEGLRYNAMRGGMFHIGPDDRIFGWSGWPYGREYDFDDADATAAYLADFENGEIELSGRRTTAIYTMAIKR